MPFFVSRIELHDVSPHTSRETYQKLHDAMESEGFTRTVNHGGVSMHLPPGEYALNRELTADQVHARAVAAAKRVGKPFEAITNQSSNFRETGLKRV